MTLAAVPDRLAARLSISAITLIGGLIGAVVVANTVAQIRLNGWNGDFYGAIEQRDLPSFLDQLIVFCWLAAILLILVVAQTYLVEIAKVRVREKMTSELLDAWLKPRRAFELSLAGEVGTNPDQRLQEDVRRLSDLSVGLAVGLFQSSLLLVTFVGVLWTLSTPMPIELFGTTIVVHGLMLWGTLAFSIVGSLLTFRVGAPLVRIHRRRYAQEAAFRFTIARAAEAAQEISFHRGEGSERLTIGSAFETVTRITTELAGAIAAVTWVTSGYGWLAIVAPVVVAAPAYFSGALTFGGLMMVVQAFYQVNQSLRWFVDNYATIADYRATRTRVAEFRDALERVDSLGESEARIAVVPSVDGSVAFEHLSIKLPEGCAGFSEDCITIRPGERVLVIGEAGAGKSMLFRAMAGLWPWGSGTIRMPPERDVMFLTQRPYVPFGTLRAALSYPKDPGRWSDAELAAALERVDLGGYSDELDVSQRWDRALTIDEQQRLTFARCLLQAPRWVLLDEAASACAEEHRTTLLSVLNNELRDAALIGVAREAGTDNLFRRRIVLRRTAAPRLRLVLPGSGGPSATMPGVTSAAGRTGASAAASADPSRAGPPAVPVEPGSVGLTGVRPLSEP